jgi:hypothetical protein
MSVNGVTGSTQTYTDYSAASTQTTAKAATTDSTSQSTDTSGVIYEKSSESTATATTTNTKQNTAIIEQLKADAENRTNQMKQLVQQLMSKQGDAYGKANDMWQFLASGNFTVDAATKAQAQADIADDGYWGVEQTSDRIIDFAKALSGDDPDKMTKMVDAFKKGYEMAAKKWGGNLPDISQRTYDAVIEKFNKWQNENGTSVTE